MTERISIRNGLLDVMCGYSVAGDRCGSAFRTDAELVLPASFCPSNIPKLRLNEDRKRPPALSVLLGVIIETQENENNVESGG